MGSACPLGSPARDLERGFSPEQAFLIGDVDHVNLFNGNLMLTIPSTTYTAEIRELYTYGGRQGRVSQRDTKLYFQGTNDEAFTQSWGYDDLGNGTTLGYPQFTFAACSGVSTPRTLTNSYTRDRLTAVSGYASSITYHPNGMVNQVVHANGVTDTTANDPNDMRRPASLTAAAGTTTRWTSGTYRYDGAGNVTQIGTSWYLYDGVDRLTTGTVFTGTTGGGTQKQQTYTYDRHGNITAIGGTSGRSTPTSASTNRLTGASVAYDAAGNLTFWNGNGYDYDPFNQMIHMTAGTEEWLYMYTADDERVWSFKVNANPRFDRWTLRDLSGQVLRVYEPLNWSWAGSLTADYVYRDGQLLAVQRSTGVQHFHLDRLGTPRLTTNATGSQLAYHVYYPFGEEATVFNQDTEVMKVHGA